MCKINVLNNKISVIKDANYDIFGCLYILTRSEYFLIESDGITYQIGSSTKKFLCSNMKLQTLQLLMMQIYFKKTIFSIYLLEQKNLYSIY